jgi:hypothetical protein
VIIHSSFKEWVATEVLPLQKKNPTWHRLDGESTGSNRNVVGRFMYAGRPWGVHGDTRLEPIQRAYDALVNGRVKDPFVIKRTVKNIRDCLDLVPQLKVPKQPKHFYVYA